MCRGFVFFLNIFVSFIALLPSVHTSPLLNLRSNAVGSDSQTAVSSLSNKFDVYATTTTKAPTTSTTTTFPSNPCATWGCPSKNTKCSIGTTGPTGSAAGCVVNFQKVIYNLNFNPAAGITSSDVTVQNTPELQSSLQALTNGATSWNVAVDSFAYMSGTGSYAAVVAVTANIWCANCATSSLNQAAVVMTSGVSSSSFAATGWPITSVTMCQPQTAVNAVCGNGLVAVLPTVSSSSGGGGGGVDGGTVAGAVLGSVAGVALILAGIIWYRNKYSNGNNPLFNMTKAEGNSTQYPQPSQPAPALSTTPMQRPIPSSSLGGEENHLAIQPAGTPSLPSGTLSTSASVPYAQSSQHGAISYTGQPRPPVYTGSTAPAPPPKRANSPPPQMQNNYAGLEVSPTSQAWNQAPQVNYGWNNNRGH